MLSYEMYTVYGMKFPHHTLRVYLSYGRYDGGREMGTYEGYRRNISTVWM